MQFKFLIVFNFIYAGVVNGQQTGVIDTASLLGRCKYIDSVSQFSMAIINEDLNFLRKGTEPSKGSVLWYDINGALTKIVEYRKHKSLIYRKIYYVWNSQLINTLTCTVDDTLRVETNFDDTTGFKTENCQSRVIDEMNHRLVRGSALKEIESTLIAFHDYSYLYRRRGR